MTVTLICYKYLTNFNKMSEFLRTLYKPQLYHGIKKHDKFFEGWYFKIVSKSEDLVIAIIPGIFKNRDKSKEHSFIQFLDGKSRNSHYINYLSSDFTAKKENFEVQIKDSFFSERHIKLNISTKELKLEGEINLNDNYPWPITTLSPGIMGYYAFVPVMQCNHGVLSMESSVSGELNYNGKQISLNGGKAYIEKDWGSAFPSSYVWLQCNHFKENKVSLFGSVANIPWLFSSFTGFLFGLLLKDQLYRFTTYTGAKIDKIAISDDTVELTIIDRKHKLEITAYKSEGATLLAPYDENMLGRVSETLDSKILFKFYKKSGKNYNLIYESEGKHAGLEVTGDVKELYGK